MTGSGIPARNINTWAGYTPAAYPRDNFGAIIPDPNTGGLFNSTVPMQDTTHIYGSWAECPYAAPWIPTVATQVGNANNDPTNNTVNGW